MKNAGKAMKEIHGKMTMEDVDVTMYALRYPFPYTPILYHRLHHSSLPPECLLPLAFERMLI